MSEHIQIRALEHCAGTPERPAFRVALETRDRPGPAYKHGVYSDDAVWFQLEGGLMIAKARVRESWRGEYSRIDEIRKRVASITLPESFWSGRPRRGYAVVALLDQERWVEPAWRGPRSYGYEWVTLENDAKSASWLDEKPPPRGGDGLVERFVLARARSFAP